MKRFLKYLRRLRKKIRKMFFSGPDMLSARQRLLSSGDLSNGEKALLVRVSTRVHYKDDMYDPEGVQQYLAVGLSAIRCIDSALTASRKGKDMRTILDFPCGYGRVLRFIRARFPDADITAADILPAALEFCQREFAVKAVRSSTDFSKVSLSGKFDLIWCGSLVTHVDEKATTQLLEMFRGLLARDGLLLFSTNGTVMVNQLKQSSGGAGENGRQSLLSQYHKTGYGYIDNENQIGYGTSIVTRERMVAIAASIGLHHNTFYLEKGWNKHQDVYGFTLTD